MTRALIVTHRRSLEAKYGAAAVQKHIAPALAAYAKAVDWVRKYPDESRTHLDGFTAIEESLVKEVPLSGFTMYNEFKPSDVEVFQKFFDVFTERKIFSRRVDVKSLIYTA